MGKSDRLPLPSDLARGHSQFQAWRDQCGGRGRIPRALWAMAVRLAKIHGVRRTAAVLGLDGDRLKVQAEVVDEPPQLSGPAFVELPSPFVGKSGVFEFDNGAGTTLRVQLMGYDAADLEALARGFWSTR